MSKPGKRRLPVRTIVMSSTFFFLPFLIALDRTGWLVIVGALLYLLLFVAIWKDVRRPAADE